MCKFSYAENKPSLRRNLRIQYSVYNCTYNFSKSTKNRKPLKQFQPIFSITIKKKKKETIKNMKIAPLKKFPLEKQLIDYKTPPFHNKFNSSLKFFNLPTLYLWMVHSCPSNRGLDGRIITTTRPSPAVRPRFLRHPTEWKGWNLTPARA